MKIVIISTMWCPSCLVMKKVYKNLEKDYFNLEFNYLDLDFDKEASIYNVGTILPVMIIFKDGKEISRIIGEQTIKELKYKLEKMNIK